jgi:t-SNARE complex subunit (syntaxin)
MRQILEEGQKKFADALEQKKQDHPPTPKGRKTEDLTQMSNKTLMAKTEETIVEQDTRLEALANAAAGIKTVAVNINEELVDQKPLLDKLEDGVDKNVASMESAESKMSKFLKDGGNTRWCALTIILIIELIVMYLLL